MRSAPLRGIRQSIGELCRIAGLTISEPVAEFQVGMDARFKNGLVVLVALVEDVQHFGGKREFLLLAEVEGEGCVEAFTIPFDATGTSRLQGLTKPHFIKLRLFESGKEIASTFYWRSNSVYSEEKREEAVGPCAGGFEELVNLPRTTLKVERTAQGVRVTNTGDKLAFFVRIKAVKDGKLVVPVHYSNNYLNLLPGEDVDVRVDDLPMGARFHVSAWNVE